MILKNDLFWKIGEYFHIWTETKAQHPDSDAASDAILRPTLQEEAVSGLISKLFKGIYHNILVNIKLSNIDTYKIDYKN